MNKRGFSLFELMIVIALITVIVVCGFFYHKSFDHYLVRHELDTLYMTFINLAYKAYWQKKDICLMFDLQGTYKYENTLHTLDKGASFGVQENLKGPPSHPTTLINHPITFTNNRVMFYADGTIQAGTVYLTDKHHSICYALSAPIAQISYIRCYVYNNGSWVLLT